MAELCPNCGRVMRRGVRSSEADRKYMKEFFKRYVSRGQEVSLYDIPNYHRVRRRGDATRKALLDLVDAGFLTKQMKPGPYGANRMYFRRVP
jgi:hypothetical protein